MPVPDWSPLGGSRIRTAAWFDGGAFIFEPSHQMLETCGQRRRKIVLCGEHSSDRRSDDAIADVRPFERCRLFATHNVLLNLVCPEPAVSAALSLQKRNRRASASFRETRS